MSDKLLGYIFLSMVLLLLTVACMFGFFKLVKPTYTYVITFDTISGIFKDDPVRMNGIIIGHISHISSDAHRVFVTIRCYNELQLRSNYCITNQSVGLLGDCLISINPGSLPHSVLSPIPESLQGYYNPNIADILAQLERYMLIFKNFKLNITSTISKSDANTASLFSLYTGIKNLNHTLTQSNLSLFSFESQIDTVLSKIVHLSELYTKLLNQYTPAAHSVKQLYSPTTDISDYVRSLEALVNFCFILSNNLYLFNTSTEETLVEIKNELKKLRTNMSIIDKNINTVKTRISIF